MPLNIKQLVKRAEEYVAMEAHTKVKRVVFAERFHLLGREDVVLLFLRRTRKTQSGGSSVVPRQ
jgi:hypothetical protein